MLGRRGAIALTCAAALLVPAAAHANAFDDTLKEYTQTGAVDGCKYTAAQLSQAKAQMPKDIAQTAPGYPAQLAAAAQKRAKGCTKAEEQATSTSTAAAPAATTTTAPARDHGRRPRRRRRRDRDDGAWRDRDDGAGRDPGALRHDHRAGDHRARRHAAAGDRAGHRSGCAADLLAPRRPPRPHRGRRVLVMLLALWAFARWWAWEPRWLVRWRHATAEAGWRASAAWAEFTDWLRFGR